MNISDAPLTATRTSWKRILSSSWGASGAFDNAFDDGDARRMRGNTHGQILPKWV